jgi:uncharacterized protein YidB (DUF937 family)
MGIFDDAVPGGNISRPLMIALGALLVGKLMSHGQPGAQPTGSQSTPQPQPQAGGGWGGLGGLLDRLSNAGHADVAHSWVGTGPNMPIQPNQLGSTLGQTTVSDLARQAGISEQELLAQLSRVLPGVVDRLTPNGRVPGQDEVRSAFGRWNAG